MSKRILSILLVALSTPLNVTFLPFRISGAHAEQKSPQIRTIG